MLTICREKMEQLWVSMRSELLPGGEEQARDLPSPDQEEQAEPSKRGRRPTATASLCQDHPEVEGVSLASYLH